MQLFDDVVTTTDTDSLPGQKSDTGSGQSGVAGNATTLFRDAARPSGTTFTGTGLSVSEKNLQPITVVNGDRVIVGGSEAARTVISNQAVLQNPDMRLAYAAAAVRSQLPSNQYTNPALAVPIPGQQAFNVVINNQSVGTLTRIDQSAFNVAPQAEQQPVPPPPTPNPPQEPAVNDGSSKPASPITEEATKPTTEDSTKTTDEVSKESDDSKKPDDSTNPNGGGCCPNTKPNRGGGGGGGMGGMGGLGSLLQIGMMVGLMAMMFGRGGGGAMGGLLGMSMISMLMRGGMGGGMGSMAGLMMFPWLISAFRR